MEIDERIAHLSHEINALISKFAELEFRKIKNGYITETGELDTIIDPKEIEDEIDECREIMNEDLFELDQCIGERDGLER
jgi:hypothetical protein